MEDITGKQLNQYQIVTPLGEGGMAAVYKAYQPSMERYVALKILPRQLALDPMFMGRFEQEAKLIASLQHPHILPVFDYGQADGYTYIVMPFVESGTLSDLFQGEPLPFDQIRNITVQVGDALDYAHSRGIVHRDIKPSNILIDERGNCLLADFGIAKMVEGTAQFTQTGGIIGTPAYMSPEQGLGTRLDGRSDIYSLGVILYEMATGHPPYSAETPMAIVLKHIHDPLPPPRSVNPQISEGLEGIILKALAKNRDERYATCGDLVRAIQSLRIPKMETPATLIEAAPAVTATLVEPAGPEPASEMEQFAPQTAAPDLTPPSKAPGADRPGWFLWAIAGAGVLGLGLIVILGGLLIGAIINRNKQAVPELTIPASAEAALETHPSATDAAVLVDTETPQPSATNIPTETPSVTPEPTLGIGSTWVSPMDGSIMVYIPAGEFIMGSDPGEPYFWGAEAPKHTIYLEAFWIQRTEVTNRMYTECLADGACPSPEYSNSNTHPEYFNDPAYADYPVIYVTYMAAEAYCQWIGARLPSEAEWEKAARGTDGRLYPWGNQELDSNRANFCDAGCPNPNEDEIESVFDDGYQDTAPVGSYPDGTSPYGALDMAGNVLEWVSDWYAVDYYGSSPYENPSGPNSGSRHPIRGGSWYNGREGLRAAARASLAPDGTYETLGFRCAMDVAE